jgi:DNA-binding response OmpR family regulator
MAALVPKHRRKFARAPAKPDEEFFVDESLSRIPSVYLKQIQRLSRFLPVIVLIPRSTAKNQLTRRQSSVAKSSGKGSRTIKLLQASGKEVARFKNSSEKSMFVFGDVTVNFSAMEAVRNGELVVFTTGEFKTLKYLIQNAGRVISREELLNDVWGYENYPCTRTVDNRILRLRQKLELDPARPVHFRTVHGTGYKFLP